MSVQVVDFIEDFILGMNFTQSVLSFSDDGTNTTIVVTNTYHVRRNMSVVIDTVSYPVVSSNSATGEIVVTGVLGAAVLITYPTPFYKHGTPYATNAELSGKQFDSGKFPLIYLAEVIVEDINNTTDSRTKNAANLRLFFLDEAGTDWNTDSHYSQRINGQRALAEKFVADLQLQPLVNDKELLSYQYRNHAKFGVESTDKGHTNSLFNERTSGVELTITVPFLNLNPCIDITPFSCPSLCTLIDSAPSQDTVDCIEAAGKTDEVKALICPTQNTPDQFTLDELNIVTGFLTTTQRNGIQGIQPIQTGVTVSTEPGDDGFYQEGRLVSFMVLKSDNKWNNTDRFTDTAGNQNYDGTLGSIAGIGVDWAQGGDEGLWFQTALPNADTQTNTMAAAESSTFGGFSNWRLENTNEGMGFMHRGVLSHRMNYGIFTNVVEADRIWSSTPKEPNTPDQYDFFKLKAIDNLLGIAMETEVGWAKGIFVRTP